MAGGGVDDDRPAAAIADATTVCRACQRRLTLYAYTPDDLARLDDLVTQLGEEHAHNCKAARGAT